MLNRSIVALDQLNKAEITQLMPKISCFSTFKIGLELFNQLGKDYVKHFTHTYQKKIFLDLKLHDIPKTVHQAIKSLEGIEIEFLTIHLSGGAEMISQAIKAQQKYLPQTKILGVSYLTSLGTNDFKSLYNTDDQHEIKRLFKNLFRLGMENNIHGFISSPHELYLIKEVEKSFENNYLKITPGIRPQNTDKGDQKRVMTPKEAFHNGADFIVVGRPITKSNNLGEIIKELS